ncbi:uncharacterized protein LOC132173941 isoform X2 [Corylus avellana]|nr:uncharacterized protein LOC132173941 isoform X2 [Corylus avellana]
MDKSWMTKSRGTREYRDGCKLFVEFAVSNCRTPDGFIYCPCKICRNNRRHPPGFVFDHLTGGKGVMPEYTLWYYHGEKHVQGPGTGSNSNRPAADANASANQVMRFSAMRFRQITSKIVRSGNYVRIRDDWTKVPECTKEDIWDALMVDFFVPPECNMVAIKKNAFRDIGTELRTWRHELKKDLAIQPDDTPDTVRARVGQERLSEYDPFDLEILLDKWCSKKNQEYAAHMKSLRALNNTPHCTGSKSYARVTHEDERMEELIPTDPAASSSVTERTVRWASNNAYAQAIGNKPEYAGRVRQVGPNVLPVRGTIHSYYTPSQARSQNTRHFAVSQELLDKALEAERAHYKAQLEARLAAEREQIVARVALQVVANLAEKKAQMTAMFEARLRRLEEMMWSSSAPEVAHYKGALDIASPPFAIVTSSVDSGSASGYHGEDAIDIDDLD